MAKAEPKKFPCPHCQQEFTQKGLPGHIAFKHKGAAASDDKTKTQSPPTEPLNKPGDSKREGIFGGW